MAIALEWDLDSRLIDRRGVAQLVNTTIGIK